MIAVCKYSGSVRFVVTLSVCASVYVSVDRPPTMILFVHLHCMALYLIVHLAVCLCLTVGQSDSRTILGISELSWNLGLSKCLARRCWTWLAKQTFPLAEEDMEI